MRIVGGGLDVGGGRADAVAHAPGVVARRHPRVGRHLGALAVDLDPPRAAPDLVVADEVGGDAVAGALVVAVLELRREGALEEPVEGDRLDVVRFEHEADLSQRLDDLVADRAR